MLKLTVETTSDSITSYEFQLDRSEITIGRSASCDIQLPFHAISSHHLTIIREADTYMVADVGSTNGTTLNGQELLADRYVPIAAGDLLLLDDVIVTVKAIHEPTGLTGENTSDLVRSMAADYLHGEQQNGEAYLEVIQGPNKGERFTLPSSGKEIVVGSGNDVDWHLNDSLLAPRSIAVVAQQDTYTLRSLSETDDPLLDGYPVLPEKTVRLRGGGRIRIGGSTVLFVDALDSYLTELERLESDTHRAITDEQVVAPTETTRRVARDAITTAPSMRVPRPGQSLSQTMPPEGSPRTERAIQPQPTVGWRAIDVALVICAVLLSIGALFLLLVVFGAITFG